MIGELREPVTPKHDCEDCGWEWPLAGEPPMDAECDNCGGMLIPKLCSLCGKVPHEPGDCFCLACRVEVLAMTEVVNDPVERLLTQHWHFCPLSDLDSTLCRCGERFDGGPGYHRTHVATLIYEALGLVGPLPHTPAAYSGDDS